MRVLVLKTLACMMVVSLVLPAAPARAVTDFTPVTGPIFMDPSEKLTGGEADRIIRIIIRMIKNTPKGETIRIATLGMNVESMKDALLTAYDRGVAIKIVLPISQKDVPVPKALAKRFNRPKVHDNSYVAYCTGGCYDDGTENLMHSKIFMASKTGNASQVVLTTSKNLRSTTTSNAYNDAYVTVGDTPIYNTTRAYFDKMQNDTVGTITPSVTSGGRTYYFFPNPGTTIANDFYTRTLSNIKCTGAARGYGNENGHTKVFISNPIWLASRKDVSERLVQLRQEGCAVRVMISTGKSSAYAMRVLVNGNVPVRYTDQFTETGYRYLYAHSKYMIISGKLGATKRMAKVYTGTSNMAISADTVNENMMIEIRNDLATYTRYEQNFEMIWGHSHDLTEVQLAEMSENGTEGD